jgi:DNA-binding NarL/FixJ family response regulator
MAISETTVKSHLNRAYHKLHLSDRLQAALYVERHGLDPGD